MCTDIQYFNQLKQATVSTSLIVPVLKSAGVSDSRSLKPPCRRTASKPRSPHRQSITSWWTEVGQARSRALPPRRWKAGAHAWWSAPWRGWSLGGFLPAGTGRTPCSGTRCIPEARWSTPTSRCPQSQQRGGPAGRTGCDCELGHQEMHGASWHAGPGAQVLKVQAWLVLYEKHRAG